MRCVPCFVNLVVLAGLFLTSIAHCVAESLKISSFDNPPYIVDMGNGKYDGLFVEVIREAASRSGVDVEFHVTDWPSAQKAVKGGLSDAIFPVVHTKERMEWLIYPEQPFSTFDFKIFAKRDAGFDFTGDISMLSGIRVGKIAKGKMHPAFTVAEQSGKIVIKERTNVALLVDALVQGEIDAFGAPNLMGLWAVRQRQAKGIVAFKESFGVSEIYLALSKKSDKLAEWKALLSEAMLLSMDEASLSY